MSSHASFENGKPELLLSARASNGARLGISMPSRYITAVCFTITFNSEFRVIRCFGNHSSIIRVLVRL